ncbi:hypothetical protein T02_4212 [Trichinella nativa]|uniref:Uncharacterized protein n=1 Tax=Trichinella nativa TaxID=6335 RepID=A0A0V1LIA3_9BILA|nr:hypothetical protein T02_4212 [Trichinella nativa]
MGYRLFHIDKEKLSRELCDRETREYVFCTPLLVTDRLMLIKSIFEEKNFSRKFQNFMGYRLAYFLFPDYCGRRTTEWTCSNMYIHSEFSIEIDLCKTGKPWKESAFVATTAKLYLLIRFTFLLS